MDDSCTSIILLPWRWCEFPKEKHQALLHSLTSFRVTIMEDLLVRIRREAEEALESEPELGPLLHHTVLHEQVKCFEDAVASTMVYRLLSCTSSTTSDPPIDPSCLFKCFQEAFQQPPTESSGGSIATAIREDVLAVVDRDPACETVLEVVLFFKGFAALACYRLANYRWKNVIHKKRRSFLSLWIQSQCSSVFGVDIHPAATIGAGVMFDHGTSIVVGETAVIGDGCTLLHGVTLGGTGKESGDRHPKVGKHVLIGAGAKILGNLRIGDAAKIGAGSVVLRAIPAGATAVGAPAKIIGRTKEADPASSMDEDLMNVAKLHKSPSAVTVATEPETDSEDGTEVDGDNPLDAGLLCPFREYTLLSLKAPPGSISILTLRKVLFPRGFTSCKIGAIMFDLDTKNVGHVSRKLFEERGQETFQRIAQLPADEAKEIWTSILAEAGSHVRQGQ